MGYENPTPSCVHVHVRCTCTCIVHLTVNYAKLFELNDAIEIEPLD
jgi:hypothetical protein